MRQQQLFFANEHGGPQSSVLIHTRPKTPLLLGWRFDYSSDPAQYFGDIRQEGWKMEKRSSSSLDDLLWIYNY